MLVLVVEFVVALVLGMVGVFEVAPPVALVVVFVELSICGEPVVLVAPLVDELPLVPMAWPGVAPFSVADPLVDVAPFVVIEPPADAPDSGVAELVVAEPLVDIEPFAGVPLVLIEPLVDMLPLAPAVVPGLLSCCSLSCAVVWSSAAVSLEDAAFTCLRW